MTPDQTPQTDDNLDPVLLASEAEWASFSLTEPHPLRRLLTNIGHALALALAPQRHYARHEVRPTHHQSFMSWVGWLTVAAVLLIYTVLVSVFYLAPRAVVRSAHHPPHPTPPGDLT